MYSTKLKPDNNRYIAKCIVNSSGPKVIDFVVDTGAKYTCCNYLSIDPKLEETDLSDREYKLLGGIIEGEVLKVYRYNASQFTIGSVDMSQQNIWITFDERATDDVIGMDILKQIHFYQDANNSEMYFSNDKSEFLPLIGSL